MASFNEQLKNLLMTLSSPHYYIFLRDFILIFCYTDTLMLIFDPVIQPPFLIYYASFNNSNVFVRTRQNILINEERTRKHRKVNTTVWLM